MAFFKKANAHVQEIKKSRITKSDIDFFDELSVTIEKIRGQLNNGPIKTLLHGVETDAANLSLSLSNGGHLDPRNNLAGSLGDFKDKFDNFVEAFVRFSKNPTVISSLIFAKELLERFVDLQ
jgi:hypothetical protein